MLTLEKGDVSAMASKTFMTRIIREGSIDKREVTPPADLVRALRAGAPAK